MFPRRYRDFRLSTIENPSPNLSSAVATTVVFLPPGISRRETLRVHEVRLTLVAHGGNHATCYVLRGPPFGFSIRSWGKPPRPRCFTATQWLPKTANSYPQRAALLLRGEALKCFIFHSNEIRHKLT